MLVPWLTWAYVFWTSGTIRSFSGDESFMHIEYTPRVRDETKKAAHNANGGGGISRL